VKVFSFNAALDVTNSMRNFLASVSRFNIPHPNVLSTTCTDFWVHDAATQQVVEKRAVVLMEHMAFHSLQDIGQAVFDRMDPQFYMEWSLFVKGVIREVLLGLSEIHRQCTHRNIKPSNILVGGGGEVKLSDFGFSASITTSLRNNMPTSSLLGNQLGHCEAAADERFSTNMYYFSPERIEGWERPSRCADIWSIGVCAAEMLWGYNPFLGAEYFPFTGKHRTMEGQFAEHEELSSVLEAYMGGVSEEAVRRLAPPNLPPPDDSLVKFLCNCWGGRRTVPGAVQYRMSAQDMLNEAMRDGGHWLRGGMTVEQIPHFLQNLGLPGEPCRWHHPNCFLCTRCEHGDTF